MPNRMHLPAWTVRIVSVVFLATVPTTCLIVGLLNPPSLEAGTDVAIPKPTDALLPPPPPPKLEPSVVNITVGSTARELRDAVESSITVHHRHEEEWTPAKRLLNGVPFEYKYYIWRGPISFRTEGNRVVTEFPDVRYRLRVRLKQQDGSAKIAECGYGPDAHMRMTLQAYTDIQWNENWTVKTSTSFGRPQFGEPCRLAPLDVDATELLNGWFAQRLPPVASAIDQTFLKRAEAKNRAQIVWDKFQEPLELGPDLWLTYRPQNPRAGSWTLDRDQSVHTIISMVFDPLIQAGAKPPLETTPLPPLQTKPPGEQGFHLAVPMLVPYEELNKVLAKEMVGQEIVPPVGSNIRITAVRAYGSGNKLISEVTLSGGINGRLYLQGNPTIDPEGRTLELRNFDFTVDTSNILVKFTNRIMYDTIREKVAQNTRIDLGDRIALLRRQVERQMNRELSPGIWIQGAVTKLSPRSIYPVKGGVEAQLVLDGTLKLIIQ
ncbi:DUF4403 family protein [Petrachloros mirabilis]